MTAMILKVSDVLVLLFVFFILIFATIIYCYMTEENPLS